MCLTAIYVGLKAIDGALMGRDENRKNGSIRESTLDDAHGTAQDLSILVLVGWDTT